MTNHTYRIALSHRHSDGLRLRRARKTHPCVMPVARSNPPATVRAWDHGEVPDDHTDLILPGQWYVENVLLAEPFRAGPRYCLACSLAAGIAEPDQFDLFAGGDA